MIGRKQSTIGAITLALAGCATAPSPPPAAVPPPVAAPPALNTLGLERVVGHNAAALAALFGKPDMDVREESARKLQFASSICVLDAYLYPPKRGAEPVVTYVDARQPDGRDIDRASCVAALVRREGGR